MGKYKFKPFTLPSGKVVYIQGYEDKYLCTLLQEFREEEILVCDESPYYVPYKWYGKTRKYFPDFFIPSQNMFVEVKCEYTFSRRKCFERKTRAKLEACNNLGYKTRLVVYKNGSKNICLFEEEEGR